MKRKRADFGKSVNNLIGNFDFFMQSSLEESNNHSWPYSSLINEIKGTDDKLLLTVN